MKIRSLVLIAGVPGAGKSHLAEKIKASAVFKDTCVVSSDWFFRTGITNYEDPEACDLAALQSTVLQLESGETVTVRYRDHFSTGTRVLSWQDALVVEGVYALSLPTLNERAGLRIYLSIPLYLAGARRAIRDVITYHDSAERALERINDNVLPAIDRYIAPQRAQADLEYAGEQDWPGLLERLALLRSQGVPRHNS